MNTSKLFLVLVFFIAVSGAVANEAQQIEQDKVQLTAIDQRVNKGDKMAVRDAAKLNVSVAIPYLSRLVLDQSTDWERSVIAGNALATIPRHGEYMRQMILAHPNDINLKMRVMDTLSKLGTKDAVRAVAYFLMNDDTPAMVTDDCSVSSGKFTAAFALGKMNLPDAPTTTKWYAYGDRELGQWQKWWTERQHDY